MSSTEKGYLIPSLRRLRHFTSLSIRNLGLGVGGALPSLYFTLSTLEGRVLYQSEDAPPGISPDWMPIEWSLESRCAPGVALGLEGKEQFVGGAVGGPEGLASPSVYIRVYARGRSQSSGCTLVGSHHTLPRYFPASEGEGDGRSSGTGTGVHLLLEQLLVLRDLTFLGFDLVRALSIARGVVGGRRAGIPRAPGEEGGNVTLPPEAAPYNLDTLPLNTLIIGLVDGHYVLPDTSALMLKAPSVLAMGSMVTAASGAGGSSGNGGSALSPPSKGGVATGSGRGGGGGDEGGGGGGMVGVGGSMGSLAKHNLRGSFDGINRLMQLGRDTGEAERQRCAALAKVVEVASVRLGGGVGVEGGKGASTLLCEQATRILALRAQLKGVVSEGDELERECEALEVGVKSGREACTQASKDLASTAALLPGMEGELEEAAGETLLLRSLLTAKQLSLLAELKALYPIKESDGGARYTIRGITLPHGDGAALVTSAPEEQIATALGYTAHCVYLASKYLGVPLRYAIVCMASHSSVRDEVGGMLLGGSGVGGVLEGGGGGEFGGFELGGFGGGGGGMNALGGLSMSSLPMSTTPSSASLISSAASNSSISSSGASSTTNSSSALSSAQNSNAANLNAPRNGAGKEWPLYWKNNADKEGVKVGLRLLTRNVQQLLASQGIQFQDHVHLLASLARLFNILLEAGVANV